jgi:hypothetical protein
LNRFQNLKPFAGEISLEYECVSNELAVRIGVLGSRELGRDLALTRRTVEQ